MEIIPAIICKFEPLSNNIDDPPHEIFYPSFINILRFYLFRSAYNSYEKWRENGRRTSID